MQTLSINFQIPSNWAELGDKQLRYVYSLLAADFSCKREQRSSSLEPMPSAAENERSYFTSDDMKTLCLLQWSCTKVVGRQDSGAYLLKKGKFLFEVTPVMLAEILPHLDWLANLPTTPVRPSKLNRRPALAADFQGVPFETYIVVDNLYQGYLTTQSDDLLDELASVLYPGIKTPLSAENRIAVFYWIASLKDFFARKYPDFLQPAASDGDNLLGTSSATAVEDAMNAQIRALTKGDVTKEQEILALDTWRALTELNAQAREYKELQLSPSCGYSELHPAARE